MSFCFAVPVSPLSAHPGTLQWTVVDTPGNTGNVVVSPSEINTIAIGCDGRTFYAVDIPHSKLYKSADGGITWDDLTSRLASAGAVLPAWDIAIAPDNPDLLAVVTSDAGLPRKVFISTNGGARWQDAKCPAVSNIGAIDVSMSCSGHDIVIGTRTGAGGGSVYIFKVTGYSGWVAQGFSGDVLAAEFSPAYVGDAGLVIVSADAGGTYINLGIRDMAANATNWSTWGPVEVTAAGPGTSPKSNQIVTADLELVSDFSGQIARLRRMYVSTHDANASGNAGVYCVDDTSIHRVMPATSARMISSIAYYGTYNKGKLLAAEVAANTSSASVNVWCSLNPCGAYSGWQNSVKPPTGGGSSGYANAQVVWSPDGSRAYCGTSSADLDVAGWPAGYLTAVALDESAFSVTLDNGKTWNQLGLVDTEISLLSDVVASADSEVLYLASVNTNGGFNGFDSIWRSTSQPVGRTWERVLCLLASTDYVILRMSPDDAGQSVFFAVRSGNDLRQSRDSGQSWYSALPGIGITDFTVTQTREDGIQQMYVLGDNFVRRGESATHTWRWGAKVDTCLDSGHTISATPAGVVVVGDAAGGMVAYSDDGGAQFSRTSPVPAPGKMHAVVDVRIQDYIVIYAASSSAGGRVYCWVVDASSRWTQMGSPGQRFSGLAQAGTLYAPWSTGRFTAVDRTLNPEALAPPLIEWDSLATGLSSGVVFTREPTSLKVSNGVDLWVIDDRPYTDTTGRLWVFSDCLTTGPGPVEPGTGLSFRAPTPVSPAMNEVIPVDLGTGEIADIKFEWRHSTPAKEYDLWLAEDSEFRGMILQETIAPDSQILPVWTLSPVTASLEAGTTYYWKLRVSRAANGEAGNGQWAEVMSFIVGQGLVQPDAPILLAPADDVRDVDRSPLFSWAPVPGATEYEFTLATDEALEQIVARVNVPAETYSYDAGLDKGSTYFWQARATKPLSGQPSPTFSFTVASNIAGLPPWLWITIAVLVAAALIVLAVSRIKPDTLKR